MSDNEMLYCLVAFIIGWLASRMIGEGFTIGAVPTTSACQNGLQDVCASFKGREDACVDCANSYPDQPTGVVNPLKNRDGTPYCSASMITDWCSTPCGQDGKLCGGRQSAAGEWPECCDGLDCGNPEPYPMQTTCRRCNSTMKKLCSGNNNWLSGGNCELACGPQSKNANELKGAGCTLDNALHWCNCGVKLQELCPGMSGKGAKCHDCAMEHLSELRDPGGQGGGDCHEGIANLVFDEYCDAPNEAV